MQILITCDAVGGHCPHTDSIICHNLTYVYLRIDISMYHMHVHTSTLYVLWNRSPVWCLSVFVFMIAPLCVCIGWQIVDRQRVQWQVRGGCGGRLILSLALSSYWFPSILFSSCQNSQLCIDSSLLDPIFTKQHNKVRIKWLLAGGISSNAPFCVFHQKLSIDLRRILIHFLEICELSLLVKGAEAWAKLYHENLIDHDRT